MAKSQGFFTRVVFTKFFIIENIDKLDKNVYIKQVASFFYCHGNHYLIYYIVYCVRGDVK